MRKSELVYHEEKDLLRNLKTYFESFEE